MNIYLNIFRTNIVSDPQQNSVGRDTHSSAFSTTSVAYHKGKVFTYGECLHATIKYSAQCISCNHNKTKNIINMKCDLGFCDECLKYIIPDEELDYGKNTPLILFSVYNYQEWCAKHGIVTNGPTLWN